MAGGNMIQVDPESVRQVASNCNQISTQLQECETKLSSSLSTLQAALQGQAASTFEAKVGHWLKTIHDMTTAITDTSQTLNQVATEADTQIQQIQKLGALADS